MALVSAAVVGVIDVEDGARDDGDELIVVISSFETVDGLAKEDVESSCGVFLVVIAVVSTPCVDDGFIVGDTIVVTGVVDVVIVVGVDVTSAVGDEVVADGDVVPSVVVFVDDVAVVVADANDVGVVDGVISVATVVVDAVVSNAVENGEDETVVDDAAVVDVVADVTDVGTDVDALTVVLDLSASAKQVYI